MPPGTEETAGSPFTIHAPRAAGDRRGNPPWLPDSTHTPEHKLLRNQRPLLRGLSWAEKREKTRTLLETDPLWLRLRTRAVEQSSAPRMVVREPGAE